MARHRGRPISHWIELLQSDDEKVRSQASFALHEIGRAAVPSLIPILEDERAKVSFLAGFTLQQIGVDSIPALVEALDKAGDRLRWNVVHWLTEIEGSVDELITSLSDSSEEYCRLSSYALHLLGRDDSCSAQVVLALRAALEDEANDPQLRGRAAFTLGTLKAVATNAVPTLLNALMDAATFVRWQAAKALGTIEATQAVPALQALFEDEDEVDQVRHWAVWALCQIRPEGLAVVRRSTEGEPVSLRRLACMGIAEASSELPKLRTVLRRLAKDEDSEVRRVAQKALKAE